MFRNSSKSNSKGDIGILVEGNVNYRAELGEIVEKDIRSNKSYNSPTSAKLITKKPDYFKEYFEYPEITGEYDIEIRERESQSAPYQALVEIPKIRYATPISKSREEARRETEFIKSIGVDTISYEYRSGDWYRMGSFFVSESTETQSSDGTWQALDTSVVPPETTLVVESEGGFFGRFWNSIKIWQR